MLRGFSLFALACVVTAASAVAAPPKGMPMLPPQPAVRPAGIPAGALMVSPCIQKMGEHWADPKVAMLPNGAMGPIYGTYQGKVIFSEVMVPKTLLDKGFVYNDLRPLPGHTIDHVNIAYEPKGHTGMPVPHYDIHAYYISPTQQAKICPGGIPDPSMKA